MSEKMLSYKPFTVGKFTTDGTIIYNGQFSTVCLGFNTETQEKVVIKIAKKSFEEKSTKFKLQINREIELLKSMSHPNIVKLYDVFRQPVTQEVCLVLEYCDLGNLENYLQKQPGNRVDEQKFKELFIQFVEGLRYLRSKNIIHRDLKPENILLCSSSHRSTSSVPLLKIADFGFSRMTSTESAMAQTICGTPYYMAPEIWSYLPYTYKVDLWSLGAIVYRMISGQLPPRPSSTTNRSFPKPSASLVCTVSPSLLDLLDRLLQPNPEIRIDWKEFLAHPYVASLNSTSSHNLSTSSLSLDPPLPHLYPTQHELSEPSEEILHNFEFSAFDVNDTPTDNNQSTDNNTNTLTLTEFHIVNNDSADAKLQDQQTSPIRSQTEQQSSDRHFMRVLACIRVAEHHATQCPVEAFVLYIASLRTLRQLYNEIKTTSGDKISFCTPERIRAQYRRALQSAERCMTELNPSALTPVDDALDILWRCVLVLGRNGAVDEASERYESSIEQYVLGQLCIEFIVSQLSPSDSKLSTLHQFHDKFTLRLAAVQSHAHNFVPQFLLPRT